MQNKKSLLQRLLVIYVTFFIVLLASIAHGFLPNFSRGYSAGTAMGQDIVQNWASGTPRLIYMLNDIPVRHTQFGITGDSTNIESVKASVTELDLTVEQSAPGTSPVGLAFSSLGGSPWIYGLVMLGFLFYVAIIVLMFLIIHSLRRSIRNELPLAKRNVWLLRMIGLLTILTELFGDFTKWRMANRAAEVLAESTYVVDTSFQISYPMVIMGILIIFAAEVFAIGQNLSEEQKLTI